MIEAYQDITTLNHLTLAHLAGHAAPYETCLVLMIYCVVFSVHTVPGRVRGVSTEVCTVDPVAAVFDNISPVVARRSRLD